MRDSISCTYTRALNRRKKAIIYLIWCAGLPLTYTLEFTHALLVCSVATIILLWCCVNKQDSVRYLSHLGETE